MTRGKATTKKKQKRTFTISGDNEGLPCLLMASVCPGGYCHQCPIYLDWQKRGEMVIMCAWCTKVLRRKPGLGQSGVSHEICYECWQK